jgi:hypothetical protein
MNWLDKGGFRTQARHEAGSVRSFVRIMPVHHQLINSFISCRDSNLNAVLWLLAIDRETRNEPQMMKNA